jgi:hypothetical protein
MEMARSAAASSEIEELKHRVHELQSRQRDSAARLAEIQRRPCARLRACPCPPPDPVL